MRVCLLAPVDPCSRGGCPCSLASFSICVCLCALFCHLCVALGSHSPLVISTPCCIRVLRSRSIKPVSESGVNELLKSTAGLPDRCGMLDSLGSSLKDINCTNRSHNWNAPTIPTINHDLSIAFLVSPAKLLCDKKNKQTSKP